MKLFEKYKYKAQAFIWKEIRQSWEKVVMCKTCGHYVDIRHTTAIQDKKDVPYCYAPAYYCKTCGLPSK